MLIKSIETINHPILGSTVFHFHDQNGHPNKTIVLAGDNGCGKSTLLDIIFEFGSQIKQKLVNSEKRKFTLVFNDREVEAYFEQFGSIISEKNIVNNEFLLTFDKSKPSAATCDLELAVKEANGAIRSIKHTDRNFGEAVFRQICRTTYSPAEISFRAQNIEAVRATALDNEERSRTKPSENFATEIHQLLIDITNKDANEAHAWAKANRGKTIPDELLDRRIGRFSQAFSLIAPHIQTVGVEDRENLKVFVFKSYGKEVAINSLSSGEKQIVIRSAQILRDQNQLHGNIICIDEPEISLHPKWQEKVLQYYKVLVSNDKKIQQCQIFIATHSPQIIHSCIDEQVIILKRNPKDGTIKIQTDPTFQGFTKEEIVRSAFDYQGVLESVAEKNVLLVEGITDKIILETAWQKLFGNKVKNFQIFSMFDAKFLQNLMNRGDIFQEFSEVTFLAMFDFDAAYDEWNGTKLNISFETDPKNGITKKNESNTGYAFLIPRPDSRDQFADVRYGGKSFLSLEYLFEDAQIPSNMEEIRSLAGGGTGRYFRDRYNKNAEKIIQSYKTSEFKNFKAVFDNIQKCIDDSSRITSAA